MLASRRQAACAAQQALEALWQASPARSQSSSRPTPRPRAAPAARPPPPAAADAVGAPPPQAAQQDQLVAQQDEWVEVTDRLTG